MKGRHLAGLLGSGAILVVVAFGFPIALARWGRWPDVRRPSGDWLERLTDSAVSDNTVLSVLTLAAGVVWLLFMVAVVTELVAGLRGRPAPRVTFVVLQRPARALALSILMAASALRPPSPAGAAPAPAPLPVAATYATAMTVPATPPKVIEVQDGDEIWDLAERHLGSGLRWEDIWALNRNLPQPDGGMWSNPAHLRSGWTLRLPDGPDLPAASPEEVRVVVRGDTLSAIALEELGDPDLYPTIFDENRGRPQPDGRTLTDPDLIIPGWELTIPGAEPSPPPAPTIPEPESLPAPQPPVEPPATTPPTEAPTTTIRTSDRVPARPDEGPTEAPAARSAPSDTRFVGVAGGIVLATALVGRMVRLRRRRGVRGAHQARHLVAPVESAIARAADVPLIVWAGQALSDMVAALDPRTITAAPLAVEVSPDTGLEVLWDGPQSATPPHGWIVADGGAAWRAAYDPEAPVPPNSRPAAVPALVTVGHRDGRQLLVDLEAWGAFAVAGPDEPVDALLRSVTLELAAGDDLSDAWVSTVDLDVSCADAFERLQPVERDDALTRLATAARETEDALGRIGSPDTFAARAANPTPIEATVVVLGGGLDLDSHWAAVVPPRRGVALLGPGDPGVTSAWIDLDEDGNGKLQPLGIDFRAAGVPPDEADAVRSTLSELADLELAGVEASADSSADEPEVTRPETADADEVVRPEQEPALVIHVLGTPSIPLRPRIGRRELVLAALLACRGGSLAATAAQDAIWGGKAVEAKTVWNFVAATRRALGALDDGAPVMPSTDRVRGRLSLDPRVTTDLALLTTGFEKAKDASSSEAMALLTDGLDLVQGAPFDGAGYDWAFRDQDVAEASRLIEDAVRLLVDLALDAGRSGVAREAIAKGLRGLPGNEELYRLRMQIEHDAGQRAGVVAAYDELVMYLADLECEPSEATTALYHELTRRSERT